MSAATRTPPARAHRRRLRCAVVALAVVGSCALAGCTGTGAGAKATPTSSKGGTETSAASSPAKVGSSSLDGTPLSIACDTLVPSTVVTNVYAGMVADTTPKTPAGTDAAVISADRGTVCSWSDTASGATMTLAVGQYADASLTRLKNNLVTASSQVPTYAGEGYFSLDGKTGTAEAFTGSYWVVAISDTAAFIEPGGAEPVVDAALSAVKGR